MNGLQKIFWRLRYAGMENTKKSKQELKHQSVLITIDGSEKSLKGWQYLDYLEKKLTSIKHNGIPINVRSELARWYYKYDLKGLNVFLKIVKQNAIKHNKKMVKIANKNGQKLSLKANESN